MSIESIKVPDLGGADSVEVIEICVAVGDEIDIDDAVVVLESDKATMEVPSPMAGIVTAINVSDGDALSEGDALIDLEVRSGNVESDDTSPAESGETRQAQPAAVETERPLETAKASVDPDPAAASDSATTPDPAATSVAPVAVPDLGGPGQVAVIEVCVAPGEEVAEGDSLVVLESDKASMEVPSPRAGRVVSVTVREGDQVSTGQQILQLESVAASTDTVARSVPDASKSGVGRSTSAATEPRESPKSSAIPTPAFTPPQPAKAAESAPAQNAPGRIYAGPAVRKLAREMGVALDAISGTGPRGRITKDDLKAHVKSRLAEKIPVSTGSGIPSVPTVDFAKFGEVRIEPMSKIHKITAESMHRSWLNVPHVTQFDEVDITELEDFRQSLKSEAQKRDIKLTPIPFLLKACATTLKAHPKFNASLHADGESIVYKQYVHIGMAVDTPLGLVVPVLRDADKKSVWELAAEVAELAQKAKDRKLSPAEMQGGCFTISSLGNIGGQGFTPIVNTPEVSILGVSRMAVKPVWDGSQFVPRKLLPLSLSYDHRVINGADAGRFFTFLNTLLSDIRRLVL